MYYNKRGRTMPVTVRFNEKELEAIRAFAELQGTTVSAVLRKAIFEQIEDALDYKIAVDAHDEWVKDGCKTYTHEEVWATIN
jgi:predicted DNA-binding protein